MTQESFPLDVEVFAPGFMYVAKPGSFDVLCIKIGYTRDPAARMRQLRKPATPGSMDLIAWWAAHPDDEISFHAAHFADRVPTSTNKRELYVPSPRFVKALLWVLSDAERDRVLRLAHGWQAETVRGVLEGMSDTWQHRMGLLLDDEDE